MKESGRGGHCRCVDVKSGAYPISSSSRSKEYRIQFSQERIASLGKKAWK